MLRDLFKHMSEFDLSFFSNSTASQFLRHFLLKGTLQDIEVLQKRLRRLLGDLTFLEAFNLSGEQAVVTFGSVIHHDNMMSVVVGGDSTAMHVCQLSIDEA